LAVAKIIGTRLITMFYSREYAAASQVFIVLMTATAIHCVGGVLTSGIMSARCFRIQVPLFGLVMGSSALASWLLVPTCGLAGGAMAMVVGAVVRLVLAGAVVSYIFVVRAKGVAELRAPHTRVDEWHSAL
jgi:O-antigen/teichoic acid export membrane protein